MKCFRLQEYELGKVYVESHYKDANKELISYTDRIIENFIGFREQNNVVKCI